MWDLAVREEDFKAARAMVERYSTRAPLSFRIPIAHAQRDTAEILRLREEARNLDARQSQIAARYVATHVADLESAEELARLDLAPRRNAAIRLGAQTFLAWLEVARGRWSRAQAAFDSAADMQGGAGTLVDRAIAVTLPFLEVPPQAVIDTRRIVSDWDPSRDALPATTGVGNALRSHLRLYLLGLLSARLGELERALRHAYELERLPAPPQGENVVRGLAATVRGDVAVRQKRYLDALQVLEQANGEIPLELVFVKPFVTVREYTQEHARFLRIEALLGLGRNAEVRPWLETSFQGSPLEFIYRAPVRERLTSIQGSRSPVP